MNFTKVFKEAIVFGIITIFIGFIGSFIARKILPIPSKTEWFNKYHIMEVSLFITGFLMHIFLEFLEINKWYCKSNYM